MTALAEPTTRVTDDASLAENYRRIRTFTESLCQPLETEDYVVQSMPDTSPTKWHLAHTAWFFEAFILARQKGWQSPEPAFHYLFNSYYNTLGEQYFRPDRGKISRPTVREVYDYRRQIDEAMLELLEKGVDAEVAPLVEVGLNHEQQHQELILTDLKHMLSCNPLFPAYTENIEAASATSTEPRWLRFEEGLYRIGKDFELGDGPGRFSYDNEGPRHRVFLETFELRSRLLTCGDVLDFMADGGYETPTLWLADGWATVQEKGWRAPLYWWREADGSYSQFTLAGKRPVVADQPACHLSFFEADALARWSGARLPSEAEWEVAAAQVLGGDAYERALGRANLAESGRLHPAPVRRGAEDDFQLIGDVWEWTQSAYAPYPGFSPPPGALGEYNAKFMNNQIVLRGGSCATPASHIRLTYRNFFPSSARWQFTGLRLARGAEGGA